MNEISPNGGAIDEAALKLSGSPFQLSPGNKRKGGSDMGALVGVGEPTDLSACLLPLLEVLGWRGDQHQVAESLPHFVENFDVTSFRNVMASLGYESQKADVKLNALSPDQLPCLFLSDKLDAQVLVSLNADRVEAFDSAQGRYIELSPDSRKGTAYFFDLAGRSEEADDEDAVDWFKGLSDRFRSHVFEILAITFLINLLALAAPLFVMAVYDWAIAGGRVSIIVYLAVGAAIAVLCDLSLRSLRAGVFSFIGARLDHIVGIEIFRKIVHLPAAFIERAAVGAQVFRIKNFETVRKFFTGPIAPALFELPFALIFIGVIAALGGSIALVPIVMLVLAAGLGMAALPLADKIAGKAEEAEIQKQELTIETLGGMRAIKYCGAEATWVRRYRQLSARAALRSFYMAQFSSLLETLSHVVIVAAGFVTVALGVSKVQSGDMTMGALVACLILVWRALQPLQTGLESLTRLTHVDSGVNHLNSLMGARPKEGLVPLAQSGKKIEGRITFTNVSIRYEADATPALDGATFDIKSGKIVAILGSNGAGKSTMLKLLAGMYHPDGGSIQIDGRDIRDINAAELRRSVAYVPQTPRFFYGTIAQNLRLSNPTATEEDLRWALRQAGALEDIEAMEQGSGDWKRTGLEVRLGDRGAGQASPGLIQRLNLARGYLKRAPIVLLDEPGNGLDLKGDKALIRALANLRGETTVFIVTHRPSHLKMADRIIWLEYGSVRSVGRPKVVMQKTRGML
ncbi:MAG: ATP-binding cassette domain-containing protein [Rhodospirillales bacterium]|nr:ATP-binding cassette domain-containing protein [Rhodospirillales bacterium]